MKIFIHCVGKLKERYLSDACAEYCKRLGAYCRPEILELPEFRLPDPAECSAAAPAPEQEDSERTENCSGTLVGGHAGRGGKTRK